MEIPKTFWRYYDLFRRGLLSLSAFSRKSSLSETEILCYLKEIKKEREKWG